MNEWAVLGLGGNKCDECGGLVIVTESILVCRKCGFVLKCKYIPELQPDVVRVRGRRGRFPNRRFKRDTFTANGRFIKVVAMIDMYPMGDMITYILTVRRSNGFLLERNVYASCHSESMQLRILEWFRMPEVRNA